MTTGAAPIHPVTRKPMARCPKCGHWSGLTGLDGLQCWGCALAEVGIKVAP